METHGEGTESEPMEKHISTAVMSCRCTCTNSPFNQPAMNNLMHDIEATWAWLRNQHAGPSPTPQGLLTMSVYRSWEGVQRRRCEKGSGQVVWGEVKEVDRQRTRMDSEQNPIDGTVNECRMITDQFTRLTQPMHRSSCCDDGIIHLESQQRLQPVYCKGKGTWQHTHTFLSHWTWVFRIKTAFISMMWGRSDLQRLVVVGRCTSWCGKCHLFVNQQEKLPN